MWLMSAATPAVLTTSYKTSWVTSGDCFNNNDIGWPIPPEAPNTATLALFWGKEWALFRIVFQPCRFHK